jgi:hypothetical protein
MKRQLRTIPVVVCIAAFFSTHPASAQSGAADMLKGGTSDANTLLNGYLGPVAKAFGSGLNSGWYNTAKPHGTGGFDVTMSFNLAFAPAADQSYSITGMNVIKPTGSETTAPSIFGPNDKDGPNVNIYQPNPNYGITPGASKDTATGNFNLPKGTGVNFFPVPTAQISVGVYKNTEVMLRLIPQISAGGFSTGLWGFGVKHDFKQWIPGIKEMPFDLSGLFGFTSFNASYAFSPPNNLNPDVPNGTTSGNTINTNTAAYDNQKLAITSTAWTVQAIISKKLLFFTPYLGVGYGYSNTEIKMAGNYPYTEFITSGTPLTNPNYGKKEVKVVTDPVTISGNASSFRATLGFRLKLTLLTIHADYTLAAYNVATLGVGLNLQSIVPFKM